MDGLVLWLPMDEGSGNITYDYSGYGNNGTLYNGTTICGGIDNCHLWVDGKINKAINFDGADDYVQVLNSLSLNITGTITIAVWFNQGAGGNYFEVVVAKPLAYFIGWRNAADYRATSGLFFSDGTQYYLRSSTTLPSDWLNKWHFLVGTYDGNIMKLYIYGVLNNSHTISKTIRITSYNLHIGKFFTTDWFNGIVDEVLIYNRALNEEEIKELYYHGLENKFNITVGLLNSGYADFGNSFNAIVYLKNGSILQLPLVLDRALSKGYYLEKILTIDGYYPSYGLVDKIMVCSNDCQGVCSEIKINNQC